MGVGDPPGASSRQPATHFTVPAPLTASHDCSQFDCGHHELDRWLKERALPGEGVSARSYVVCDAGSPAHATVVGYYTLSAGAILLDALPNAKLRRGMPREVPAMLIGRLAVDRQVQGRGLGSALLKDGILRVIGISREAGVRAIFVHSIDARAERFYVGFGFRHALDGRTMLLPLEMAAKVMRQPL